MGTIEKLLDVEISDLSKDVTGVAQGDLPIFNKGLDIKCAVDTKKAKLLKAIREWTLKDPKVQHDIAKALFIYEGGNLKEDWVLAELRVKEKYLGRAIITQRAIAAAL